MPIINYKENGLNYIAKEVNEINKSKGWNVLTEDDWNDTYKIPAVLALVTTETSEAVEAFRKNDYENFKEEIADQIIRLLDICGGLKIDIDKEIRNKLEKNKLRSHRHGGKRV